ncbi:MAG: hypothetical protein CL758_05190 [Chloroflexi bacterium]|nr:hypothetical protein [Chloroflexota bacterium]
MKNLIKFIFITFIILFLVFYKDSGINKSYDFIVSPFKYSLIEWEIQNIFDKWIYKISNKSKISKTQVIENHFYNKNEHDLIDFSNDEDEIEEFIEKSLSVVIKEQNINFIGGVQFPPVDIRLIEIPKLLVISPRDKIVHMDDILIKPYISSKEIIYIEEKFLNQHDLSAIILDIGGIATFPSSIPKNKNIKKIFIISLHEWVHHYLFFTKLGQNMFSSQEMRILNETLATRVSEELYSYVVEYLKVNYKFNNNDMNKIENEINNTERIETFNFRDEMMKTRIETEKLLKENRVSDAENYMESQRDIFVDNGYNIRKLNQAYFAFYGSYADSSASNTSIGTELTEFRSYFVDIESFISAIKTVSNYNEFKNKLYKLRLESE